MIVGGGFAGLHAAKKLASAPVEITIVDLNNHHLFQPLLYQIATGGLSPGEIASPLRVILSKYKNIEVLMAKAVDILPSENKLILSDGELEYDILVLATGSHQNYFGNDGWQKKAPGLKNIENALEIRRRIFLAFEAAERESDPERRKELMTFIIVGGGPTGVELAGSLGELAHRTLVRDFRNIDPNRTQVVLVQSGNRILKPFHRESSKRALKSLQKLGVKVLTNCRVTGITDDEVSISTGNKKQTLRAKTILWTAGVKASPLGKILADRTGIQTEKNGKVPVKDDLSVPGFPNIFVLGDLASCKDANGNPLPALASVAKQQGLYAGTHIKCKLQGKATKPFVYKNKGILAVIGRNAAVADLKRVRLSRFPAWIIWVLVHIAMLVEFDNKIIVMIQYAVNYFTKKRGAQLITGQSYFPLVTPSNHKKQDQPKAKVPTETT